jgi:hypothetical protein
MEERTFVCPVCRKEKTAAKGAAVPVCHGKPMEASPLPSCTKPPADAENARAADADEPCDNGRQPKKR